MVFPIIKSIIVIFLLVEYAFYLYFVQPLLRSKSASNAPGSGSTPALFGGGGGAAGLFRSLTQPLLSISQQRRIINSCNCVPATACLRVKRPSLRELFTGGNRNCPQPRVCCEQIRPTQSPFPSSESNSRPQQKPTQNPTTRATTTTTAAPSPSPPAFLSNPIIPSQRSDNDNNAQKPSAPNDNGLNLSETETQELQAKLLDSLLSGFGLPSNNPADSSNSNNNPNPAQAQTPKPASAAPPPSFLVNPIIPSSVNANTPPQNSNLPNLSEAETRALQARLLSSLFSGFGLPGNPANNNGNNPSGNTGAQFPVDSMKRSPSLDEIKLRNLLEETEPSVVTTKSDNNKSDSNDGKSTLTNSTLDLLTNPLLKKLIEAVQTAERNGDSEKSKGSTMAPIALST